MKTSFLTRFGCLTTLALGLAVGSANADPINITVQGGTYSVTAGVGTITGGSTSGITLTSAIDKSVLGGIGDSDIFTWLKADVAAYNTSAGTSLLTPTATNSGGTAFVKVDDPSAPSITLTGYDYLVLHWGGSHGGFIQAFQLPDSGTFNFSTVKPSTAGGLSSYAFYGPSGVSVPDGGTTLVLLGLALVGLSVFRRKALNAA
jgi:hypothetical protein